MTSRFLDESSQLAFEALLCELADSRYCLVKQPLHFPRMAWNSDLDLFAESLDSICRAAERCWVNDSSLRQVRVKLLTGGQAHVDLCDEEKFVRIDVYTQVPSYPELRLSRGLFEDLLENRQLVTFAGQGSHSVNAWCPSPQYDALIRLIEYTQYYWVGPDKVHHLEFLMSTDPGDAREVISLLHRYTSLPKNQPDRPKRRALANFGHQVKRRLSRYVVLQRIVRSSVVAAAFRKIRR